jgi:hypothetical protein
MPEIGKKKKMKAIGGFNPLKNGRRASKNNSLTFS